MVGVFKYEHGLKFVGYAESEIEAKKSIFDKYAEDWEKEIYCGREVEWFNKGKKEHRGAPRCFDIVSISHI